MFYEENISALYVVLSALFTYLFIIVNTCITNGASFSTNSEFRGVVVCISGVTCGGKSTITKLLHQRLKGSVVIKQDDYYLEDDDPMHVQLPELQWRNRERMTALDMSQMRKDVEDIVCRMGPSMPILIVDGFLLYYDKYITSICDIKLFFTLGKDMCKERRKKRNKRIQDIDSYFEQYVWPAYLKYREVSFQENPDIILVDGGNNNISIVESIISLLKNKVVRVKKL